MHKYAKGFLLIALVWTPCPAYATVVDVPLGGNAFLTQTTTGFTETIAADGLHNWTSSSSVISVYFDVPQAGNLSLSLVGGLFGSTQSTVNVSIGNDSRQIALSPAGASGTVFAVGTFSIGTPGYVRVDLQGVTNNGGYFGDISALQIDGPAAVGALFANDGANFYWSRRGPSVHLWHQALPAGTKYLYSEITVPPGEDPVGSYYMANGFDTGYFGMQVNSPTLRWILFSVWDADATPAGETQLVVAGAGVTAQRFGGVGTGGQSYLQYPWVAGRTYGFVTRQQPNSENGNTQYTAWFREVNKPGGDWLFSDGFDGPVPWHLLATWQYAKVQPFTYWYSFVEGFNPDTGYLPRLAEFGNEWAVSVGSVWTELTQAWFDVDATGNNQQRLDFGGSARGVQYELRMDGFFNPAPSEHANQTFTRNPNIVAPLLNLGTLPEN